MGNGSGRQSINSNRREIAMAKKTSSKKTAKKTSTKKAGAKKVSSKKAAPKKSTDSPNIKHPEAAQKVRSLIEQEITEIFHSPLMVGKLGREHGLSPEQAMETIAAITSPIFAQLKPE
jgi:hypothetical protein